MSKSQSLALSVSQRLRRRANRLLLRSVGGADRSGFFDIDAVNPGLATIAEHYDEIRQELLEIIPKSDGIPLYHQIDADQQEISGESQGDWRVLMLALKGAAEGFPNRHLCPNTCAILEDVPNVLQAFFSILSPGKCVPAHRGVSIWFLRYHMAFIVPVENPPTMRVVDQCYTWKERECMIFDDTLEHEITNEADSVRVVLIIDVPRPLPWYLRLIDGVVRLLDGPAWDDDRWRTIFRRIEAKI